MSMHSIHEAKAHLSRLIERAVNGEEVVITKAGKPVVRLVPYEKATIPERKPGFWRGRVKIKGDFDKLPGSVWGAFRGKQNH